MYCTEMLTVLELLQRTLISQQLSECSYLGWSSGWQSSREVLALSSRCQTKMYLRQKRAQRGLGNSWAYLTVNPEGEGQLTANSGQWSRGLKILVSVVRFRPGPPRMTKTTFGWFFLFANLKILL